MASLQSPTHKPLSHFYQKQPTFPFYMFMSFLYTFIKGVGTVLFCGTVPSSVLSPAILWKMLFFPWVTCINSQNAKLCPGLSFPPPVSRHDFLCFISYLAHGPYLFAVVGTYSLQFCLLFHVSRFTVPEKYCLQSCIIFAYLNYHHNNMCNLSCNNYKIIQW